MFMPSKDEPKELSSKDREEVEQLSMHSEEDKFTAKNEPQT